MKYIRKIEKKLLKLLRLFKSPTSIVKYSKILFRKKQILAPCNFTYELSLRYRWRIFKYDCDFYLIMTPAQQLKHKKSLLKFFLKKIDQLEVLLSHTMGDADIIDDIMYVYSRSAQIDRWGLNKLIATIGFYQIGELQAKMVYDKLRVEHLMEIGNTYKSLETIDNTTRDEIWKLLLYIDQLNRQYAFLYRYNIRFFFIKFHRIVSSTTRSVTIIKLRGVKASDFTWYNKLHSVIFSTISRPLARVYNLALRKAFLEDDYSLLLMLLLLTILFIYLLSRIIT